MKICITGALGHIGSAFIRDVKDLGVEKVYLVDNLLTQRYASLFNLPEDISYEFCPIDIFDEQMEQIVKDSNVLVHLAASTDAQTSFDRPEEVEKINKRGVERVADLCAKHQVPMIFPSTTSVYGVSEGVVYEDCSGEDLKPQSPYAESKIYGEKYLEKLGKEKDLSYIILRIGTIFGFSQGMRFHTAVNKFVWQACLGESISVWRTAMDQKRPYCDLQDLIRALKWIIQENIFDKTIYNIVTTNLTVRDIINTISEYVPDFSVEYVDSPIMNQLSYEVSNQKSLDKGFVYQGNIQTSLKDVIQKLKNINTSFHKIS